MIRKLLPRNDEHASFYVERCESCLIGRSRKPLYPYGYRGFESHPLRQRKKTRGQGEGETRRIFSPSPLLLVPLSPHNILERSPNWYGTALEARRVERPVRVRVPLSPLFDLESQI